MTANDKEDKILTHEYLEEFIASNGNKLFPYDSRVQVIRFLSKFDATQRGAVLLLIVIGKGEGEGAESAREYLKVITKNLA